ncbi:zinc-dependent alcohol dehydrogenase [Nocardia sp. alder85J]|uniref:zinc-dependent alcohol dehydrogenase n=1 Tax=Nocardia sp. alder85J TaxID=2862949 RepID=UPI002251F59E|nr:zinc-binding dehydrogenase [Nocardia sp. alder85J]MCX4094789.1 zinc-binding dehydrogenase [Nocardia sp. alder85J]
MPTMQSVQTGATAGTVAVVDIDRPEPGPRDALVRIRACGICGTDALFVTAGVPGPDGRLRPIPLGHEPAGEVVAVGAEVSGLADYLLIENAVVGTSVAIVPDALPFEVAALNEPMAAARHCVERSGARRGDTVVVLGGGAIGLGATIWLKLRGVEHVVVTDLLPERLATALQIGADAVIDAEREDVRGRLTALHGESTDALGVPRPGTDIYIDAAGTAAAVDTAVGAAKRGAKLVVAGIHKRPAPLDLDAVRRSELTIIGAQRHPAEIFTVTPQLAAHAGRFARILSHRIPATDVQEAFRLALTPGAAEKVVVTYPGTTVTV